MKISKHLMIDETIRFQRVHLARIKKNKCKEGLFLVCTPRQGKDLFEIIDGQYLTKKYNTCYLVGLASDEETAMEYVIKLIDQMYNHQILNYDMLKVQ